jgi:hypothetical protein
VSGQFSVELTNRWDAIAMLRLLEPYHSWTIQLGEDRWLVVGRAESKQARHDARESIVAWARERGTPEVAATFGDGAFRGSALTP